MYEKLVENVMSGALGGKAGGKRIMLFSFGFEGAGAMRELAAAIAKAGGTPDMLYEDALAKKAFLDNATPEAIEAKVAMMEKSFAEFDHFIRILAEDDFYSLAGTNRDNLRLYNRLYGTRVRDAIMLKRGYTLFNVPTIAYSAAAHMSLGAYSELWERVVSLDYSRMGDAMGPLKELMEKTDRVHIKGPGTDLEFSIKGLGAIPCAGKQNIPDGEVFSAPIKDSVNGTVQFNTPLVAPSISTQFENIRLEFKDGRIIKSKSDRNDAELARFFDIDDGARYAGEFALGVNPHITRPCGEILFDEKISGSFHIAAGCCYDECDNGNKSANHFDMICIQTPEFGGGEIYFDGRLIRRDGRFVLPELDGLNPEKLM